MSESDFPQLVGVRVLVAEDNPVDQEVAKAVLEKIGCQVELVKNGDQLLDLPDGKTFDLVLMDCHMPELDGFEATRLIRESQTSLDQKIPIIALTSDTNEVNCSRCLNVGMNDYLAKPLDLDAFVQKLEYWLFHKDVEPNFKKAA